MPQAPGVGSNLTDSLPNYFAHPEHRFSIYCHITLMTLSWVIVLPTGKYAQAPVTSALRRRAYRPRWIHIKTDTWCFQL